MNSFLTLLPGQMPLSTGDQRRFPDWNRCNEYALRQGSVLRTGTWLLWGHGNGLNYLVTNLQNIFFVADEESKVARRPLPSLALI
jgi:hypothetical protein